MLRGVIRTYHAAFSGLPRDVWLLSAVALVNRAGSMVLPFLALYLTEQRGLSVARAGALLGLYGVGSVGGSWLGGWASDRFGTERTLAWSLATSGAVFVALGLQRQPWAIALFLLLLSLTADAFRPAVMSAIGARSPAELQVRSYALLRLATNLGMTAGPAIGGMLALRSYFWLFAVDGLTSWAAAALILALPRRAVREEPEAAMGQRAGSPWRDVPFLILLLLVFALALVFFQILGTLPLYLRERYGLREDAIGALLGFNALLVVLFEMVLTHWAEGRPRLPWIGLGLLLVCAGFGLLPFGSSLAFAALTIAVWSLGEMLALPALNAVVAERAPSAQRGSYMGLYTMSFSVAFVFAPAGGTWIYDHFGGDVLWYGIGALGPALAAAALLLWKWFGPAARAR